MVRLTDRPDMTLDVYRGLKTTMQQQCNNILGEQVKLNQGMLCCHMTALVKVGI